MTQDKKILRLALIGNPNVGKTTLFNALTGSHQYVGNWPGVTVEKKAGYTKTGNCELTDLPGVYSLRPCSAEEAVTRDYLLKEPPDAVINIVDGTNLERNLYLTVQLIALGRPLVVAVNMMDDLKAKGWKLNCAALEVALGVPVVPVTARRGENAGVLLSKAESLALGQMKNRFRTIHGEKSEDAIEKIASLLNGSSLFKGDSPRFLAEKLLEGDTELIGRLCLTKAQEERVEEIARLYENGAPLGDRETLLADDRYAFIEGVARKCLDKGTNCWKPTASERIDRVITGRMLALPFFFLTMFLMFSITFGPFGKYLSHMVELFFEKLAHPFTEQLLRRFSAPDWCRSLLLDAVLDGIAGVLVFLPQIALLFFCLTLLEDSGYMARAAFIMDRLLRRIGLSGKSFIPMLMGFGCTTPAVMAARTLENERDRRMTMMLLPFMSCSARLPIYAMFAGAFFPNRQGITVFSMYLLGVLVAVLSGALLRRAVFRGEAAPFVLELPPYRIPLLGSVLRHVWEKCKGFLTKAGTLIFAMSVAVWLLQSFTPSLHPAASPAESILGCLGAWIAPVLAPLGFGSWRAAVALLSGLIAKESVVSTLSILYAPGGTEGLPAALAGSFGPAAALSFMVFSLLYMPCISAFVTLRREMRSLRWAVGTAAFSTGIAWICSFTAYRIGLLLWGGGIAARPAVQPAADSASAGVGVGNPAVALLCAALILAAMLVLLRELSLAMRGKCCCGCSGCPMRARCRHGGAIADEEGEV